MYEGIVCELKDVKKHPNADRLQVANVLGGYVVIVGLEAETGDVGVFFKPGIQLSVEYARVNKLTRDLGGFFHNNRVVKPIKLRDVQTEGFFTSLQSVYNLEDSSEVSGEQLDIGDHVSSYAGAPVCRRYESPALKRHSSGPNKAKSRQSANNIIAGLERHYSTPHFKDSAHKALKAEEGRVYVTEKLHGTSGRTSHALLKPSPLTGWLEKARNAIGLERKDKWKYVSGSRNCILKESSGGGYFGSNVFRFEAAEIFNGKLEKGETVYYEIVGYSVTGKPLAAPQRIPNESSSQLEGVWTGDKMVYSYGHDKLSVSPFGVYVYRMTKTGKDGSREEYTWEKIKRRCAEIGANHVPELLMVDLRKKCISEEGLCLLLDEIANKQLSVLTDRHIREGVCIRFEESDGEKINVYKTKSRLFQSLEHHTRTSSDEDSIDVEELS